MIINDKRALAYVVTIDEIKPIEGYDRVEYARTNGWWVIIGKNDNLKVGDKCVYFEVDSKVNAKDERFAFLEKRNYKIKTQKMCKVISQGLLMPLSLFSEIGDADINTDVTDILKVTYSVEEDNSRKIWTVYMFLVCLYWQCLCLWDTHMRPTGCSLRETIVR